VIRYRRFTGEFASASAVAAAIGVALVRDGIIPGGFVGSSDFELKGKGILMLGFGKFITAVEIL
jgi:3-oxoacyl-[acyl-carrier-protein] synthase-1/3-oxoacyl-[acyl-carrier-protein] synthase II